MASGLSAELDFYITNQEEFVSKYDGKVIVLKHGELLGVYDSKIDAWTETCKTQAEGTFLLQTVNPGEADYTGVIPYAFDMRFADSITTE